MAEGKTKITWITCPECGAKIGIVVSLGKEAEAVKGLTLEEVKGRLAEAGVDVGLLEFEEDEESIYVRPRQFLGDLWGRYNDAMKAIGGVWVREGRESRWVVSKRASQTLSR